jgi:hypothetical protein
VPASLLIWPEGALSSLTPEHLAALAGLTAAARRLAVGHGGLSEISAGAGWSISTAAFCSTPKGEVAGFITSGGW